MKIVAKLKEKKEKKILIKDIDKDFEKLAQEKDENNKIKNSKEKSLEVESYENNFFEKSWVNDKNYNEIIQKSSNRERIFKNLTNKLIVLKKDKLKDVKTSKN